MPVGSIGPHPGRCLAKLRVALMQTGHGTDGHHRGGGEHERAEQGRPPGHRPRRGSSTTPCLSTWSRRCRAVAALAACDLDVELMELVEQASELAGARG